MANYDINQTNISSFNNPSLNGMITSAKDNRISLTNISNQYLFENQAIIGFSILRKYENVLKNELYDYTIDKKYFMKPEYVSYQLYETTDLWYLLLFINDMARVEDFTKETIKVFPAETISLINKILNDEGTNISTKDSPRTVNKNYLKRLEQPSKDLLPYNVNKTIDWNNIPDYIDGLSKITSSSYLQTKRGVYIDEVLNDNDDPIKPLTLNDEGNTTISSIYFKNGFHHGEHGKVFLDGSSKYTLIPLWNGTGRLIIRDIEDSSLVFDSGKVIKQFPQPMLISDLRSASFDEQSPGNSSDIKGDSISFNKSTGEFASMSNINLSCKFTDQDDNGEYKRVDVSRLNSSDILFYNLYYNHEVLPTISDDINFTSKITYIDGKVDIYTKNIKSEHFNSKGFNSYVKFAYPNKYSTNISSVEITLNIPGNSVSKGFSINVTPMSFDEYSYVIPIKDSKYYSYEISYDYNTIDTNKRRFFSQEFMEGVMYMPLIGKIDSKGNVKFPNMNFTVESSTSDGSKVNIINPVNLPVNMNYDTTLWYELSSINFKFPETYILSASLSNMTPNSGGGIGIIFDYNQSTKSGYMIWLSTPSTVSNDSLPNFTNDNGSNILRSGYYELDPVDGTDRNVFYNDTSITLKLTNDIPFEVKKYIKIIKENTHIRIYTGSTMSEIAIANPILSITDIQNVNVKGSLGFLGLYAGSQYNITEYLEYIDPITKMNSDAEW